MSNRLEVHASWDCHHCGQPITGRGVFNMELQLGYHVYCAPVTTKRTGPHVVTDAPAAPKRTIHQTPNGSTYWRNEPALPRDRPDIRAEHEEPILGPMRCVCPSRVDQRLRHINGGVWGTVACGECARLLPSYDSRQLVMGVATSPQIEAFKKRIKQDLHAAILGVIG